MIEKLFKVLDCWLGKFVFFNSANPYHPERLPKEIVQLLNFKETLVNLVFNHSPEYSEIHQRKTFKV